MYKTYEEFMGKNRYQPFDYLARFLTLSGCVGGICVTMHVMYNNSPNGDEWEAVFGGLFWGSVGGVLGRYAHFVVPVVGTVFAIGYSMHELSKYFKNRAQIRKGLRYTGHTYVPSDD
jgi:hypothetical protein